MRRHRDIELTTLRKMISLDDLRGWTLRGHIQKSIAIYCTQDTFNDVSKVSTDVPLA